MIQVLLLILKIIGITLLAVLGLLVFILAVVLFVPIFYRVRIVHNPEKTQVKARVSFLFPFLYVMVDYFKKLSYKVRIFGIALLNSEKTKKEPKKKSKKKERKKKNPEAEKVPEFSEPETPVELQEEATPITPEIPENVLANEKPESKPEPEKSPEKKGFFENFRSKIRKIRETIGKVVKKIQKLFRQKEELQRILAKPETKKALKFVWDKLKHLLKHILPRKIKGYVAYGADDPATTGQVLGILSVVYARTGQLLTIHPNFVEKQLECDVELKGRIQVFTLLVIAVKVFINQELRQLITEVKGLKEIE